MRLLSSLPGLAVARAAALVAAFARALCRAVSRGARALALGSLVLLAACQTELYTDLTQAEANEMLSVLLANRIGAKKVALGEGSFALTVKEEEVLNALDVLRDRGLPRATRSSMGEVFAKSAIVSSPFEERIRYIYALGEGVADTIQQIDGVLTARVHIVLPEEAELGQEVRPSSAAVFIKQRANTDLDFLVPQIRRLVSNAIEGVSFDNVTVVLVEAQVEAPLVARAEADMRELVPGLRVAEASVPMVWRIGGAVVALLVLSLIANGVLAFKRLRDRKPTPETTGREVAA